MNNRIFRLILATCLMVSISLIGACSSKDTSEPTKQTTFPKSQKETQAQPAGQSKTQKSGIEETPIIEPPVKPATEGQQTGMATPPQASEPKQKFGTSEKSDPDDILPAPESESEVLEETVPPEKPAARPPKSGSHP